MRDTQMNRQGWSCASKPSNIQQQEKKKRLDSRSAFENVSSFDCQWVDATVVWSVCLYE